MICIRMDNLTFVSFALLWAQCAMHVAYTTEARPGSYQEEGAANDWPYFELI